MRSSCVGFFHQSLNKAKKYEQPSCWLSAWFCSSVRHVFLHWVGSSVCLSYAYRANLLFVMHACLPPPLLLMSATYVLMSIYALLMGLDKWQIQTTQSIWQCSHERQNTIMSDNPHPWADKPLPQSVNDTKIYLRDVKLSITESKHQAATISESRGNISFQTAAIPCSS